MVGMHQDFAYHAQRVVAFSHDAPHGDVVAKQLVATSIDEQDDELITFVSLMQYPSTLIFCFKHSSVIITRSRCACHSGRTTSGAIIVITTVSAVSL